MVLQFRRYSSLYKMIVWSTLKIMDQAPVLLKIGALLALSGCKGLDSET